MATSSLADTDPEEEDRERRSERLTLASQVNNRSRIAYRVGDAPSRLVVVIHVLALYWFSFIAKATNPAADQKYRVRECSFLAAVVDVIILRFAEMDLCMHGP